MMEENHRTWYDMETRGLLGDGRVLSMLPETVGWYTGCTVTGLTIKPDSEGFLVVLRAVERGKPVVHFTGGRSWGDAVEALMWEVHNNRLNWRPDRFAK